MVVHDGEERLHEYPPFEFELVDSHSEASACPLDPGWWWPQVVCGVLTMPELERVRHHLRKNFHHLTESTPRGRFGSHGCKLSMEPSSTTDLFSEASGLIDNHSLDSCVVDIAVYRTNLVS